MRQHGFSLAVAAYWKAAPVLGDPQDADLGNTPATMTVDLLWRALGLLPVRAECVPEQVARARAWVAGLVICRVLGTVPYRQSHSDVISGSRARTSVRQ